jgi:hypothetical protein
MVKTVKLIKDVYKIPLHLGIKGSRTASQETYQGCTIGEKINNRNTERYTFAKRSFFEKITNKYTSEKRIPQINLDFWLSDKNELRISNANPLNVQFTVKVIKASNTFTEKTKGK